MGNPTASGGVVDAVEPGGAASAVLRAGDRVLAVDGNVVRDVIDWWWLTDEPSFTVTVERDGREIELPVEKRLGEPLGVTFTETLFDSIRECDNACAFCFVSGLPRGLRPALYVRDDDFRLSFLSGNFVTLTNVDEADVARIVEQRLSPLHVSIHAVDAHVRERLICPTTEDRALEILDELLRHSIDVHVQIVLVPGVNDGAVLDETLEYLAAREGVLSVGAVPMGFTEHQPRWKSSYDAGSAAALLDQVRTWQWRMRSQKGCGWVYAADEFYLLAGADVPPSEDYDDFPQFENGIGMVAAFRDEFRPPAGAGARSATLVTGELFAPVLRVVLDRIGWSDVKVLPVRNRLFGGNVGVTGLLGGGDIAAAISADGREGTYLVPDVVVNSDGLLLDEVPADGLATLAGADVHFVGSDAGSLAEALTI